MRRAKVLLDTRAHDKMADEDPSLCQVLKQRRRWEFLEICKVEDSDGRTYTRPEDTRNTLAQHLARKFVPITVGEEALADMQRCIQPVSPSTYAEQLEKKNHLRRGTQRLARRARHQAPGIDGFSLKFYMANWDKISTELKQLLNQVFLQKHIPPKQKQGIF